MYKYPKLTILAIMALTVFQLAAGESKAFKEDGCTVTVPEGWIWFPLENPNPEFRCRAIKPSTGQVAMLQVLKGFKAIDDEFAKEMDRGSQVALKRG